MSLYINKVYKTFQCLKNWKVLERKTSTLTRKVEEKTMKWKPTPKRPILVSQHIYYSHYLHKDSSQPHLYAK